MAVSGVFFIPLQPQVERAQEGEGQKGEGFQDQGCPRKTGNGDGRRHCLSLEKAPIDQSGNAWNPCRTPLERYSNTRWRRSANCVQQDQCVEWIFRILNSDELLYNAWCSNGIQPLSTFGNHLQHVAQICPILPNSRQNPLKQNLPSRAEDAACVPLGPHGAVAARPAGVHRDAGGTPRQVLVCANTQIICENI